MKKLAVVPLLTLLTSLLFSATALAAKTTKEVSPEVLGERSTFSDRAVRERIAPAGKVCVEGKECPGAATAVVAAPAADAGAATGPRSGEDIANASCAGCHGAGLMGAPKIGNKGDWAPRLAQGMDTVLKHAVDGYKAMPPKGTCATCSEADIKAAIAFMSK